MESLAALEPSPFPVVSLYLNLTPNQNGREEYQQFVRKAFGDRAKAMAAESPERQSFEQDATRILAHLEDDHDPTVQGLAVFASSANGLFEVIPFEAPFSDHWLFVDAVPHLYPLAKLVDTYPRYAVVTLDTNKARILVVGLAATERVEQVVSDKTRRSSKGGWSQARYQRRADNMHLHHIKEVVDTLDRVVREEGLTQIVVAGEDVAVPLLKEQLPAHLAEKIVDIIKLQRHGDGAAMIEASLASLRAKDAETDAETVEQLIGEWKRGGLGVAGPEATLRALENGQVDELVITATPDTLKPVQTLASSGTAAVHADTSAPQGAADEPRLRLSAELVARAHTTGARVRFIEDAALLADIGGVGALLRYRI